MHVIIKAQITEEVNYQFARRILYVASTAVIEYRKQAIKLRILASEEFTHLVIYTPPPEEDAPFFCLENQTCSTDAINLHKRGLQEMAHLLELHPGESSNGSLQYALEFDR